MTACGVWSLLGLVAACGLARDGHPVRAVLTMAGLTSMGLYGAALAALEVR